MDEPDYTVPPTLPDWIGCLVLAAGLAFLAGVAYAAVVLWG